MIGRGRRIAGLVMLLGVVAAGCAPSKPQASSSTEAPGPTPRTITVSAPDSTVLLHLQDTLVFKPSLELMAPGLRWNLMAFPEEVLELTSAPGRYPFVFRPRNPGVGTIRATVGPPCEGPGPMAEGPQCPVAGAGSAAAGMPIRVVAVTVKVFAQGA